MTGDGSEKILDVIISTTLTLPQVRWVTKDQG